MIYKIIYYYYLLLLIILVILAIICSTIFLFNKERFPIKELEDNATFNIYFCDTAQAMLYDMSYTQLFMSNKIPEWFISKIKYTNFFDLGSGGGIASVHHLHKYFNKNIHIVLSDLYPKTKLWNKIQQKNISYIETPVNIDHLSNYLVKYPKYSVSLFGSLHHMEPDDINKLFYTVHNNNTSLFIVEPRRFNTIIQYFQILLLPFVGLLFYTLICLFGSFLIPRNIINNIIRLITVPFFMTFDHIIGASRRYTKKQLEKIASNNNLNLYHYCDMTFDYYIIT